MVGRWAQWKGYPQKITPVEQTQLVHFVSTSCTWTQDLWFALGPSHDPNFWGWTSVSQASTPCFFCRSASSLGFQGSLSSQKISRFLQSPQELPEIATRPTRPSFSLKDHNHRSIVFPGIQLRFGAPRHCVVHSMSYLRTATSPRGCEIQNSIEKNENN